MVLPSLLPLISPDPPVVSGTASVMTGVQLMHQRQTDYVVVLDASGQIGLFTAQALIQAIATGCDLAHAPITEWMTPDMAMLGESEVTDLAHIIQLFQKKGLRYLAILNDGGMERGNPVVGMITQANVWQMIDNAIPRPHLIEAIADAADRHLPLPLSLEHASDPQLDRPCMSQLAHYQAAIARLNTIINCAIASIVCFRLYPDNTWSYEYWSAGCKMVFGYTAQEFMADHWLWWNRIHPGDQHIMQTISWDIFRSENPLRREYRFYRKDGVLRWIESTSTSNYDREAHCWIVTVVDVDITERKQLEIAVKASERKLADILNSAIASITVFRHYPDHRWYYEYRSAGCEAIFGYTSDELMADETLWSSRVHPEDMESVIIPSWENVLHGHPTPREYRFYHKDGSLRWISSMLTPRWEEASQSWIVTATAIDITERKEAENSLRQSEELFRTVFEYAGMGIAMVAPPLYRLEYTNPAFQRMLGYTAEELAQIDFHRITFPDDAMREYPLIEAMRQGWRDSYILEKRYIRKDNQVIWVRLTATVLRDSVRKTRLAIALVEDISDRKRAEAATREKEEQLRLALELTHIGMWDWQVSTDELVWSDNTPKLMGLPPDMRQGNLSLWSRCVHPDDRDRVTQLAAQAFATRSTYEAEYRVLWPDHSVHWVLDRGHGIYDYRGNLIRVVGVVLEITERKAAQVALAQSEEKFRGIFNHAAQGIFYTNVAGRYVQANPKFCELTGYTLEELADKTLESLTHPDDLETARLYTPQLLSGEMNQFSMEKRVIRKDGSIIWGYITISVLREFEEPYVLGLFEDVTERKRVEHALLDSEERFRVLFEQAPLGICVDSVAGQRLRMNQRFCEILQRSEAEISQLHWTEITHPDDVEADHELMQQLLDGNIPVFSLEKRYIRPDQSLVWVHLTMSLTYNSQGEPQNLIAFIEDISDRKQAETLLQASLREKEFLLSEIHHRVKNNLQIVSSLLSLQSLQITDPTMQKLLEDSWTRIDSMALVHESLYRTRNFAQVDFDQYLHRLATNLFHIYGTHTGAVHLHMDVPRHVPLTLDQSVPCGLIVNELVTNALKHGFVDGQAGDVSVMFAIEPSGEAVLSISNTGNSLPPTFDINTVQSMGLQLVLNLVEQLEGQLHVQHADPTVFQVRFQLQSVMEDEAIA